jgi:PDZ domain-containing protein
VPARIVLESPVPVLLTHATEAPERPAAPPRPRPRPSYAPRRRDLARSVVDGDSVAEAARSFLLVSGIQNVPARTRTRARPRSRRVIAAVVSVVAAICVGFAARVPLPYHRLDGTTQPAAGLVSITGAPIDPSAGTILVTVVTSAPVTLAGVVRSWIDRSTDVERDPPSGPVTDNLRWVNERLMTESAHAATVVALGHLGLDPSAVHAAVVPHGLGGPSAGLAIALELVDLLSPGDLTDGQVVAVSGALDELGRVGTVGGIRYKAVAARRAGADLLLVPPSLYREAVLFAPGVRVVPVATFADALAALRSN